MSCIKNKDGNFVDAINGSQIIAENTYRPVNKKLAKEILKIQEENEKKGNIIYLWLSFKEGGIGGGGIYPTP